MEPEDFGRQIRERRREEGLSQEELATQVGISRNYLSQIERGQANNLSWHVRECLASALGISDGKPDRMVSEDLKLPPGLKEFAQEKKLPHDDIQMLANLKYRGRQPDTKEKWELLYNVIKMTTGK
ncbi:MAG: helix-turn-helix transcriptional regulator [Leptolyngbyaceae cyanobacterium bins.302]|nr:helix-turn-helix transcriptional regulator [Leptolyngbyaceae cyanobacterium bins.302]